MSSADVIAAHQAVGRFLDVAGIRVFVREEGEGPTVLCMHGVPASSFTYRKVLLELAARGLRGVSFDLPGLGLSDRPEDLDYGWSGLGSFSAKVADELGLESIHLVVHDLGGPVGLELAHRLPERIRSITVLNTIGNIDGFVKPWVMRPFALPGVRRLYLATFTKPTARLLMSMQGIGDTSRVTSHEIGAYVDLLKRVDGGRAFLRMMASFESTAEAEHRYRAVLRSHRVQIIWGENDPALKVEVEGEAVRRLAGVDSIHRIPGKHFLQEDQAEAIAELVAAFVRSS